MKNDFNELCSDGICEVCSNQTKVVVLASSFEPVSRAYCADCLTNGLEVYSDIVSYTWSAGGWPDLREDYVELVRRKLAKLNISEEQFIRDIQVVEDSYVEYSKQQFRVVEQRGIIIGTGYRG